MDWFDYQAAVAEATKKAGKPTQTEITRTLQTNAVAKARPFLEQSRGTDGYVDPQVYMRLRTDYGEVIGDVSDFDAIFASYLSPQERDMLGIGKESYSPPKTGGKKTKLELLEEQL